jgi:hypothetical protein
MNPWVKVGENLVRHPAGKIYLQAKVGGKVIRKSLMTTDLRLAKLKRDDELAKMRKDAEKSPDEAVPTLGDCLGTLNARTLTQPHLSESTVRYYKEVFATLAKTLPVTIHARLWTAADAAAWWKSASKAQDSGNEASRPAPFFRLPLSGTRGGRADGVALAGPQGRWRAGAQNIRPPSRRSQLGEREEAGVTLSQSLEITTATIGQSATGTTSG